MGFTVFKYSDLFLHLHTSTGTFYTLQVHFKCMLQWLLLITYANLATV